MHPPTRRGRTPVIWLAVLAAAGMTACSGSTKKLAVQPGPTTSSTSSAPTAGTATTASTATTTPNASATTAAPNTPPPTNAGHAGLTPATTTTTRAPFQPTTTTLRPPPTTTTTPFDLHPRLAFVPFGPADAATVFDDLWYNSLRKANCGGLPDDPTFAAPPADPPLNGFELYLAAVHVCKGDFAAAAADLTSLDARPFVFDPKAEQKQFGNCGQFHVYRAIKDLVKVWQEHPGFAPVFVAAPTDVIVDC